MRVVVADDSVLLREGIARLLEEAGFEVVGQAGTPDELMLKVRCYSPDVAIVDIRMPPTHTDEGLRAAQADPRAAPRRRRARPLPVRRARATRSTCSPTAPSGVGYLLKDRVTDVDRVRRGASGGSPRAARRSTRPSSRSSSAGAAADDPLDELTPREREVLELMAEGRSNQGIAERLVVTEHAVEKHVRNIFEKLAILADADDHRRVLAVLAFLQSGHGATG